MTTAARTASQKADSLFQYPWEIKSPHRCLSTLGACLLAAFLRFYPPPTLALVALASHIGHAWHVLYQQAIIHDSRIGPAWAPLQITTTVASKTLELNPKMFELRVVLGWAVGYAEVRAAWVCTHQRAPMMLPHPKPSALKA